MLFFPSDVNTLHYPSDFPRYPRVSHSIPHTYHDIPWCIRFHGIHSVPQYPTVSRRLTTMSHRLHGFTVSPQIPTVSHGISRYLTDLPRYPTVYTVSRCPIDFPRHPTVSHLLTTVSHGVYGFVPPNGHGIRQYPTLFNCIPIYPRVSRWLPAVSHGIPPTSHGIPLHIPYNFTVSRRPTVSFALYTLSCIVLLPSSLGLSRSK